MRTIISQLCKLLFRAKPIATSFILPVTVSVYRDFSGHHINGLLDSGYWLREEGLIIFLLLWVASLLAIIGFLQATIVNIKN